ncbi:MAG: flagellar biosynthesis protein FlhB [Deltaproteobacteria bacterium]|nr:MAG: flagellar biosynthesis protein FlhB [Deltaproteobacteria bacterium]
MTKRDEKRSLPKAVALRYRPPRDPAPRVTAKGAGLVAQKIIDLGREHGIPLQEDPGLIQILAQLDFYQEIPPKIYAVVAEILAFVYRLNREAPGAPHESG